MTEKKPSKHAKSPTGPVRFIVVATGADGAAIAAAAQEVADENPIGRRLVKPGDADFPSAAQIAKWTADTADPGAVVLRRNGTRFTVLDVEDAQNPAAITDAFTHAFTHSAGGPS